MNADVATAGSTTYEGLTLNWAAATDVGKVRRVNEDSYLAEPGLFVVADGMGGHAAGDVASAMAIDVCRSTAPNVPLDVSAIGELVVRANHLVYRQSVEVGPQGMGTTIVGVALVDNAGDHGLMAFNVGDSRCYLVVDGRLNQLSRDHSVVQELIDSGEISSLEATQHPDRNVVTRAIGIEPLVAADFFMLANESTTRVLLCSDGVSGHVNPDDLEGVVCSDDEPRVVVERIIELVLAGAARDNATALVVDVRRVSPDSCEATEEEVTGPRPNRAFDEATGPRPVKVSVPPESSVSPRSQTSTLDEVDVIDTATAAVAEPEPSRGFPMMQAASVPESAAPAPIAGLIDAVPTADESDPDDSTMAPEVERLGQVEISEVPW